MRALLVVLGALAFAAPAAAGGWATAGLMPPKGVAAGDTWTATVNVLQHGQTPLAGVEPSVTISKGGEAHRFPARPTKQPGVYVASVRFPSGGAWTYQVDDGFGQVHSFAPVQVGAGAVSDAGFGLPRWTILAALGAVALVLAAVFLGRLRPDASPVAQQ